MSQEIADFIQPLCGGVYVEPFCGACWVGLKVVSRRKMFADVNEDLILMYKSLQSGWVPPSSVSEEEYRKLKALPPGVDPTRAFAGFGCSFAGKFFGGYARCKRGDDYAGNAKNSLMRDYAGNANITFIHSDYRNLTYPPGALVYCDPPYKDTTKYYGTPPFNHTEFWEFCRVLSKSCTVIISEYAAPVDFSVVWEKETRTEIRTSANGREKRIERLYCV